MLRMSGNFEEAIQLYCTTKNFELEEDEFPTYVQKGLIVPTLSTHFCSEL